MQLTFHGAAGMVTGSCFLLEAGGRRMLIDCGLFQGSKALNERNYGPFPFEPASIDVVLLTHAHIDHSGLLPKLVRLGFKGPIYTTPPTKDLLEIMLSDSAHIQESEVERLNKRRARQGLPLLEPIYRADDALQVVAQVKTREFAESFPIGPDLRALFWPAGHMLGAASVIVEAGRAAAGVSDGSAPGGDGSAGTGASQGGHRIVFSGDLGVANQPLINDPAPIPIADTVVMESTYGHRLRARNDDRYERLADIVRTTFARGGNVVIPAFAVGRVQDLLYGLHRMIHSGELDPARIFVDSPLAAKATDVFCRHVEEFDEEARRFAEVVGDCPLYLRDLRITRSVEESRAINDIRSGALIISSSGMCDAGRIKHHLRHNLWRRECSIVIVSYQAEGTLGRRLVDGAKTVRIHGREVNVAAEIHNLDGFSAHADQEELVGWVKGMQQRPQRIFLVHGEPEARRALGELLERETDVPVFAPNLEDGVDLTAAKVDMPRATAAVMIAPPAPTDGPRTDGVGGSQVQAIGEGAESFADLWETVAGLQHRLDELERSGAEEQDVAAIADALAEARRWVERALSKQRHRTRGGAKTGGTGNVRDT